MKIKTAEDLFSASAKGWGWGKEKIVPGFLFFSRFALALAGKLKLSTKDNACGQAIHTLKPK